MPQRWYIGSCTAKWCDPCHEGFLASLPLSSRAWSSIAFYPIREHYFPGGSRSFDIMSTSQLIRENALYHSRILRVIEEIQCAPSSLLHQKTYLKDLQIQQQRGVKKLKNLAATTQKARRRHHDVRDSTTARLAHKVTGRSKLYKMKESKAEQCAHYQYYLYVLRALT